MAVYEATAWLEEESGWWVICVPAVKGIYTQARRWEEVASMAQDATALMLDVPLDEVEITVRQVDRPEDLDDD